MVTIRLLRSFGDLGKVCYKWSCYLSPCGPSCVVPWASPYTFVLKNSNTEKVGAGLRDYVRMYVYTYVLCMSVYVYINVYRRLLV